MSAFDDVFINRLLKSEGGYVNHPDDPGGETNWGVTVATARAAGYSGSMRSMTREQAIEIYRKLYWKPVEAMELPYALQFQVFDANVNHGLRNAVSILQRALGVAVDGKFGPVTKGVVLDHTVSEGELVVGVSFNIARLEFYTGLGTFKSFGKGWTNRVADNLGYLLEDIG